MNDLFFLIAAPFIIMALLPILLRPERIIILPAYALYRLVTFAAGVHSHLVAHFFAIKGDGP